MKKKITTTILFLTLLNSSCASIMTSQFSEVKEKSVQIQESEKTFLKSELKPEFDYLGNNNIRIKFYLENTFSVKRTEITNTKKNVPWLWSLATLGGSLLVSALIPIWGENSSDITKGVLITTSVVTLADLGLSYFFSSSESQKNYLGDTNIDEKKILENAKVVISSPNGQISEIYSDNHGEIILKNNNLLVEGSIIELPFNSKLSYRISSSDLSDKSNLINNVDVDNNIPNLNIKNPNGIAIIIGNRNYKNKDIPKVNYAFNDAKIMKEYLSKALGYNEDKIIYIEDAALTDFNRVFGTDKSSGILVNNFELINSDVFIYYSGHGAPDPNTKSAYFVPVDAEINDIGVNGYSLETFYNNLAKANAKSITVVLDSCFSGGTSDGKMLIGNASPIYIDVKSKYNLAPNMDVLTSSSGEQISSWYNEKQHSMFTYYLLKALQLGNTQDEEGINPDTNHDNTLNLEEVHSYVSQKVRKYAKKLYNRDQNSQLISKNPKKTILKY